MPDPVSASRACWCGEKNLFPFSSEFHLCKVCGTLVTAADVKPADLTVTQDSGELYSKDYWLKRQSEKYGLPPLDQRARLDLPERCVHWLNLLLKHRLPPAKVLEIGCAHGGYVALLRWAGFDASGTEMSPWIVQFARETFQVPVQTGRIEELPFAAQSLDVIILNDVIEHLPDPLGTLGHCVKLLKPDGFFIIQTPEYKEHLSYADLVATKDLFLTHMHGKNEEHLYLFSRRSTQRLWADLGLPVVAFENPIFPYDLFYAASRAKLPEHSPAEISGALVMQPTGRLVQALLDKAFESNDRWWAMQRLETQLKNK
jgi:2-polyprenyl-3-methyl-5-hydroxy-6-metoxy-1,4-benzoquinol methylase